MYILPINQYTNKNKANFKSQIAIKPIITTPKTNTGILKETTKKLIEDILHGYRDIRSVLESKNKEGLEKIKEKYTDVTIGDALIFHNCGKNKSSIVIKAGEMNKNKSLTYIARREGLSWSKRYNVLEAFMIDDKTKLIKDFEQNYYNHFPKERNYFEQDELDNSNTEENLINILSELDLAILNYRKFLATCRNEDIKTPDGIIPYDLADSVKETFDLISSITKKSQKLPILTLRELNNNFNDIYLSNDENGSFVFKNLGAENLTIKLRQISRPDENLKRLSVFDSEGNAIKTFLIKNDNKFIKNINLTHTNYIPNNYTYVDSQELETEVLPDFKKYYKLYINKLNEYNTHIDTGLKKYFKETETGVFYDWVQNLLNEIDETYSYAKLTLKRLPQETIANIKTKVTGIKYDGGKRGFWTKGFDGDKTLHFLPIKSNSHNNLTRLSIYDKNDKVVSMYLLKDNKYIIKNFNPKYPTIIPKEPIYSSKDEINNIEIAQCARFLKNKLDELVNEADNAFETRNFTKKSRITEGALRAKKIQKITKECKKQFMDAIKNFDNDIVAFNDAIMEIKEKINKFYKA